MNSIKALLCLFFFTNRHRNQVYTTCCDTVMAHYITLFLPNLLVLSEAGSSLNKEQRQEEGSLNVLSEGKVAIV